MVQAKDLKTLKRYQGYWCVIKAKTELVFDIDVYDRTLTLIKPEYLEKLECTLQEKEAAIRIMSRLQRIASVETVSRSINAILLEFGIRKDFILPDLDEEILSFIESRLEIINN